VLIRGIRDPKIELRCSIRVGGWSHLKGLGQEAGRIGGETNTHGGRLSRALLKSCEWICFGRSNKLPLEVSSSSGLIFKARIVRF
jgi:hypothetical protein